MIYLDSSALLKWSVIEFRTWWARRCALDAIHLATADPFRPELGGLVTYDVELAAASAELGIAVIAPA